MTYVVAVEGIDALRNIEELSPAIRKAAMRAVNYATRRGRTASARQMEKETSFPRGYLSGSNGRLELGRPATEGHLESSITGRFRPTSLARFAKGTVTPGRMGVRVEVNPGETKLMKRVFPIRLPQGNTLTETKFNLGLAIRLRRGETLQNKKKAVKVASGLYLLFGPSVDQVFRTVSEDQLPNVEQFLEQEFLRLMKVGDF